MPFFLFVTYAYSVEKSTNGVVRNSPWVINEPKMANIIQEIVDNAVSLYVLLPLLQKRNGISQKPMYVILC